jgi:hypothetical protein
MAKERKLFYVFQGSLHTLGFHLLCKDQSRFCLKDPGTCLDLDMNRYPMRLSQSVTLTGLDTNKFEATLEGIALVYGMFSKAMRSGQLDEWNPGIYQEWRTVSISNTYFSPGTSAPISTTSVPFHPLVDPAGVLASLVEDGHLHAADNDVGYFERVPREESGFK